MEIGKKIKILKLFSLISLSIDWSTGLETFASVNIKPSIVAILGWIIPDPFATPATVTSVPPKSNDTAISFVLLSPNASRTPS